MHTHTVTNGSKTEPYVIIQFGFIDVLQRERERQRQRQRERERERQTVSRLY